MSFEIISPVLNELLQLIIIIAVGFLVAFIRQRISREQAIALEVIVADGVLFAQQVFGHLDGKERYHQATAKITDLLKEKGIKISEDQLRILIEATVKTLKKEFGEQWKS